MCLNPFCRLSFVTTCISGKVTRPLAADDSIENDDEANVDFRIATCLVILLCGWAEAQLSDEECESYHELVTESDYETFVDDCFGKEVLGFMDGVAKKFHARLVGSQSMFNRLFKEAKRVKFQIFVENTDFMSISMPEVTHIEGIQIRNNKKLKAVRLPKAVAYNRAKVGPAAVTVDGNAVLDEQSYTQLKALCPYCDIFKPTRCDALEPVQSSDDIVALVERCQGEKIIKQKPGTKLFLDTSLMTRTSFDKLFESATHIEMCIIVKDSKWTQLVFPKLVRFHPCGSGDRSLKAVHNAKLTLLSLPVFGSEGFGNLNSIMNVELRNNFVLPPAQITSLRKTCRFCVLQIYKECDDLESRHLRNGTKFVEQCGGKQVWKGKNPTAPLQLDISKLNQALLDELFQDLVEAKICITMRGSRVKYLRMPQLQKLESCQPGRPAFLIEGNNYLKEITVSSSFDWKFSEESFHVVYAPALKKYPSFECKYCVVELNTWCGATTTRNAYKGRSQFLDICPGKKKLTFYKENFDVTEAEFKRICKSALYLQACFDIVDTSYTSVNCPNLRAVKGCTSSLPLLNITGNSNLDSIKLPAKVIYPKTEKIMYVKRNAKVTSENIKELKEICPHCHIEGFFSKCRSIDTVVSLEQFMKLCAGEAIIGGKHGLVLEFNFTESQLNQLFSKAVEVTMCLNIKAAPIKRLVFPHLTSFRSCAPGKPAINIINNPYLTTLEFPACKNGDCVQSGIVKGNLMLSTTALGKIKKVCDKCDVQEYVPACGLGDQAVGVKEFVKACAGQDIVVPGPGQSIVIESWQVTEKELNAMCANAVLMQVCIKVTESKYKSLKCPHLMELRPCKKRSLALEIVGNADLESVELPRNVMLNEKDVEWGVRPSTPANIIVVKRNPQLQPTFVDILLQICPRCNIKDHFSRCANLDAVESVDEFASECAGQPIITAKPGVKLQFNITDTELSSLFAEVVEMHMCLNVVRTSLKELVFPKLERVPALTVTTNPELEQLRFPQCATKNCIDSAVVQRNPFLPKNELDAIENVCENCLLSVELPSCGLGNKSVTGAEFVRACIGKEIIVPAHGYVPIINASEVSQIELNGFCRNAIYLQACIIIKDTSFKSLSCPKLKEIKPCKTGMPVFEIVGNHDLVKVELPSDVKIPEGEKVLLVKQNRLLPVDVILVLKRICPDCEVLSHLSKCDNLKTVTNVDDFIKRCANQPIIVIKELVLDYPFTETQLNKLFAGVVEVQLCLRIRNSKIRRLEFPKLVRWKSCSPGEPAIDFQVNAYLRRIRFPACRSANCIDNGYIKNNPDVPDAQLRDVQAVCEKCVIEKYVPACGLGNKKYTALEFVRACAGKEMIKPAKNYFTVIDATEISEKEMNAMCANAVYLEACIVISATNYKSLRCPHLKEVRPCKPGKPVFEIVGNHDLSLIQLPSRLIYPKNDKIIVVKRNPKLPQTAITLLKKICPQCSIEWFASKCSNMDSFTSVKQFLEKCSGELEIIFTRPIYINLTDVSDDQINRLFANVVELQMCLVLEQTRITKLSFPKLVRWATCGQGYPALTLKKNEHLIDLQFPSCKRGCIDSGFVMGNKKVPRRQIGQFGMYCINCVFATSDDNELACGIQKEHYTAHEFVVACANKKVIKPRPDYSVDITEDCCTEKELNDFCAKAEVLEVCLSLSNSKIQKLSCPHLKSLTPCQSGRPAIKLKDNEKLTNFVVPDDVYVPDNELIFEVSNNALPNKTLDALRAICPKCHIEGSTSAPPKDQLTRCEVGYQDYSDKELVDLCAGKQIIEPKKGYYLTVNSSKVSEDDMNRLCSNAVRMEICITIENSKYKSLRCPNLKELKPCRPGRPAISVKTNLDFSNLELNEDLKIPENTTVFEVSENPDVPLKTIEWLKKLCPKCQITANLACDLSQRKYTDKELIAACAGKRIIRPAKGSMLLLKSQDTSMEKMNALCSKAIYMEICIEITKSDYKYLRCPYLRKLKPCKSGRPAIKIVDNLDISEFEFPNNISYPKGELPFEITENPWLPLSTIKRAARICPLCKISANLGCGLTKREYTAQEVVDACAGKSIIKPAEGYMLVLNNRNISNNQMNALCSEATYMEICITISRSNYIRFDCPKLKVLKPCKKGATAITIKGNKLLERVRFSPSLKLEGNQQNLLRIRRNRRLSEQDLKNLKRLCPSCRIKQ
ncbi:hypothetical protein Q1695_014619 [Nippostrongylus brasiliensis]|nr:hypothetical protein Q1695_014619 [Nippostrongylus brasiliensis]